MARRVNHYLEKRMMQTINTVGFSTGGHKSNKKFQSSAFPLTFLKVCAMAKSAKIQTGTPGCVITLGGYPD
jgi:hypothetical protein